MYAIIREGNGQFYMSTVFGYFDKGKDSWDYNHRYWMVLNREKTALVNQCVLDRHSRFLDPIVLLVDSDQKDWKLDDERSQSVTFLPTNSIFDMVRSGHVPSDLLERCIEIDKRYFFNDYPEIKNEKEIIDFDWVSGGLHDAMISELKETDDTLYVLFDGVWGCKIEVWFSGDVSYDVSSRNPQEYDPYWGSSTVFFSDGNIYLIDDEEATIDNVRKGWCWFKANHMKYHVIPK